MQTGLAIAMEGMATRLSLCPAKMTFLEPAGSASYGPTSQSECPSTG